MKEKDRTKAERKTAAESLSAIYKYCAYQERSHQEVKVKLYGYGVHSEEVNQILSRLIVEGFLNEERFAKAFAGGKFRMKKWGRNKIIFALESKGLTNNCIRAGLGEIEDTEYKKALREVILRKSGQSDEKNNFKKRDKIARFAISKGYEPDLVWELVKVLVLG